MPLIASAEVTDPNSGTRLPAGISNWGVGAVMLTRWLALKVYVYAKFAGEHSGGVFCSHSMLNINSGGRGGSKTFSNTSNGNRGCGLRRTDLRSSTL